MTLLLTLQAISKSYGSVNLFKELSFSLREKEKVGLVGPNGAGKSTLLKILAGCDQQDEGSIVKRQGLRVGYASQMPEFPAKTLEETLFEADTYHRDHFEKETEARILLGKAQFTDFDQLASTLSGGWKKRLDIARALMQDPDILLLDEPTNHLDIEGILWLEKLLQKERRSILVVSHDRYFLENVCTKIIEINRSFPAGIFVVEGGMSTFMEKKVAMLESQKRYEQSLTSIVKDEVEWLRRSPKARTTKSRSRIQKAYELIRELSDVQSRNKTTKVSIEFSESSRETKKLLSAKNLAKSLDGRQLFKGIDITLSPGTRLGVVGKNGTGKTTLLKILAGEISQDMGTVKMAQDIRIVYFDQHREQINSNLSLRDALSPNGDYVDYRGQSIHVNGWAKKFLFSPARLSLPVRCLSGGERARISIAKLLLEPADILFLDEPTNDLDIETLEVIEDSLQDFEGAVVLISHDRCLMDQICTSVIGLGEELEERFFADYSQWERAIEGAKQPVKIVDKQLIAPIPKEKKKLNYKEQKELDSMENATIALEHHIAELQLQLEDPLISADNQKLLDTYHILGKKQQELTDLLDRWQELINKSDA